MQQLAGAVAGTRGGTGRGRSKLGRFHFFLLNMLDIGKLLLLLVFFILLFFNSKRTKTSQTWVPGW